MGKVIKNYLYNASYQLFVLIVPLITTPYLARVLGPQGVGINAYTNSIIQYFIIFGSVGVALYGNRQIAYVRNNKQKLTNTFYEIFFMRMVTIGVAYIAFFIFLAFAHRFHSYYIAQSFSLLAAAFDISWFFQGVENFGVTVLRNFIVKIITLFSIFAFVKSYNDLWLYIFILSMSLLIGNLTLFPSLRRYLGKVDWKNFHWFRHFWPSMVLFVPEIATQIYLVVNKTMLGAMTSVTAAGYFDQSDKIVKLSLAVVTATGTVMLPHVANAFMQGKHEKVKDYLYQSFEFVTALSIPIAFGIAAVSPSFVPLFFGTKFMAVVPLMMIESIVVVMIAWSNAIGVQYLVPTNQNKAYNYSVIIGAIINIVANVPLILLWGAVGTAVATVLSEASVTGIQLYAVKDEIDFRKLYHGFFKYFVAGLLMFAIVFVLDATLRVKWIDLIIEVFLGIIVYTVLIFVLKTKVSKDVITIIKKKF
ncbi:flippase [Fructilactobacillus fructivorans]|uniref:Membrane protein involved in the export of O-antigen, teichoic acid lipoteichoic acid n=1 Tax=Fructilactobacillus fructivorans TaxID=1614 RepID=A0A0C1M7B8_9LACO|nr:flippase [Fructilactobacillus fructivorans]KID42289.1 Membrane protein involved in the export of O-antigen, teichoic acid lipoteichoic acid [Fructilactobacillus fructivorans]MCT0151091.1 flippase [Fructilactobacillus fructivorans]MCT2867351.1 flippase [Fructilactobacillus fructivorans]MCT2869130.1 flippase [Fructilactobacillus fructivorans]MCT2873150.1 flippase [Fructilactobacillus fructivorans]